MNEQQAFIELGFSKMEAAVYIHLLTNPAQTGYAISKALGEAAPYIYRTLDSLAQKGAILSELGEKSVYRAVPYPELIAQLGRLYEEKCNRVAEELSQLQAVQGDSRIYSLTTVEQVYERCRAMLARCHDVAYMDLYPTPLEYLKEDIIKRESEGIRISLFTYGENDINVSRIVRMDPHRIVKHWKRQWIRVGIDGSEYLVALLNADGSKVFHAIWSENPVISWTQMYSLRSELQLAEIIQLVDGGESIEAIRNNVAGWRAGDKGKHLSGAQRIEETYKGIFKKNQD